MHLRQAFYSISTINNVCKELNIFCEKLYSTVQHTNVKTEMRYWRRIDNNSSQNTVNNVVQNFLSITMIARQLCWSPAIPFYCCRLDLLSSFFFRRLMSEVAWPIVTKICHVRRWPRFIKLSQKFGWPLPPNEIRGPKTSKFWRDFVQLCNLIVSPESNKTSSIGKRHCKLRALLHRQT